MRGDSEFREFGVLSMCGARSVFYFLNIFLPPLITMPRKLSFTRCP